MIITNAAILILVLVKVYNALKKISNSSVSNSELNLRIYRTIAISSSVLLPMLDIHWIMVPIIAHTPQIDHLSSFLDWIFIF